MFPTLVEKLGRHDPGDAEGEAKPLPQTTRRLLGDIQHFRSPRSIVAQVIKMPRSPATWAYRGTRSRLLDLFFGGAVGLSAHLTFHIKPFETARRFIGGGVEAHHGSPSRGGKYNLENRSVNLSQVMQYRPMVLRRIGDEHL